MTTGWSPPQQGLLAHAGHPKQLTITHILRKTSKYGNVMSGGRASPTDSARDRSMHHLFETTTHRRIHTSTYGNRIHLKSSTHGWNWFQHMRLSPLPPRTTSHKIANASRTRNTGINIDNENESNDDDPTFLKRQSRGNWYYRISQHNRSKRMRSKETYSVM